MKTHQKSISSTIQIEGKEFQSQASVIFQSFFQAPKTMKMVEMETGIDRANICRRVSELRELKKIVIIETKLCGITKHRAGYLTTNSALFPKDNQLKLFTE